LFPTTDDQDDDADKTDLELTRISGHYIFPSLGLLDVEKNKKIYSVLRFSEHTCAAHASVCGGGFWCPLLLQ